METRGKLVMAQMGTWAPILVLFVAFFFYARWSDGADPLVLGLLYIVTFITFLEGIGALTMIAYYSMREHPAALTVLFLYQKVLTACTVGIGTLRVWGLVDISDPLFVAIFASAFTAHSLFNNVLFFGRTRGWHLVQVDPVPFRTAWRYYKGRRRGG